MAAITSACWPANAQPAAASIPAGCRHRQHLREGHQRLDARSQPGRPAPGSRIALQGAVARLVQPAGRLDNLQRVGRGHQDLHGGEFGYSADRCQHGVELLGAEQGGLGLAGGSVVWANDGGTAKAKATTIAALRNNGPRISRSSPGRYSARRGDFQAERAGVSRAGRIGGILDVALVAGRFGRPSGRAATGGLGCEADGRGIVRRRTGSVRYEPSRL